MGHNVLKPCFPMIGFDLHGEMAVPLMIPAPSFPHVCFSVLNGVVGKVAKTITVTQDGGWKIVHRTSDIGNFIPHVPLPPVPNCLFVGVVIAFSGSKSYFGPASVQAEQGGSIGCALIFVVDVNGNCWDILSAGVGLVAPTGVVITWNTVETTLTRGDVLGGFIAMAIDAACNALLSLAAGKVAGKLAGPIFERLTRTALGKKVAWALIGRYGLFAMPMAREVVEKTVGGLVLFVTGSPLGHSVPGLLGSDYDAGSLGTAVGYDIGNSFAGDGPSDTASTPATNTPSPSPQPSPTPAPTPTSQPSPTSTPTPQPTPGPAPAPSPSPQAPPTPPSATPASAPPPGNGSVQDTVGTTGGQVPTRAEQEARRTALQQPVPARTPQPGQPGGDLAHQPIEEW